MKVVLDAGGAGPPDLKCRASKIAHQSKRACGRWAGEEAAEVATRHQRLLTLQRELAQLKRTPSMQMLARQRIPRLEAEIKQLVAVLQEGA